MVNLNTRAGWIFWLSLLAYCLAFAAFYFFTQYAAYRVDYEQEKGAFTHFEHYICGNGADCKSIKNINYIDFGDNFYTTNVEIISNKKLDVAKLQNKYAEFITQLPWYVRVQFAKEMVIHKLNEMPYKE